MDNNTNNINNHVPDENEQLLLRKKQANEAAMRQREAELARRRKLAAQREAQLKAQAMRGTPNQAQPQAQPRAQESVPVRGMSQRQAQPLPRSANGANPRPQTRPQPKPQPKPQAKQPAPPVTPAPNAATAESTAAHTSANIANENKEKKTNLSKAGAEMMSSAIKALVYIVLVVVVSIFLSILIIRVGNDIFALVKSEEVIDITIPEDATIDDVAEILHENSIISFPGLFKFYAGIKEDNGEFLAGDYSVSPSMSYDELRYAFKPKIATGTSWITFPEGSTCDEIINILVSYGIGTREGYIDVINNYDFSSYWFVKEIPQDTDRYYRLEGYLFPDTYEFYNSSSEVTVINKMLSRFNDVFVADYRTKAEELGFTVDEIITLASIVEKESGSSADFRNISSVFHNRLKNPGKFPKLESDATVIYAMQVLAGGERPETVTPEDLKLNNPYNSYLNNGLTPGAIANPSISAIRYALYPAETNYYYFVADKSGNTLFASDLKGHEQNIASIKDQ